MGFESATAEGVALTRSLERVHMSFESANAEGVALTRVPVHVM